MASIIRDPDGKKRIQWCDGPNRRVTVRLGEVSVKQAEAIKLRVEQLITARATGVLDPEAAKWLGVVDDWLHARLAKAGLVAARERSTPTLGMLLDEVFKALTVKSTTRLTYSQTRASLEGFFGLSRLLARITPLDAQKWHQKMREAGLAEATISKRTKTARAFFKMAVRWKMIAENPFADIKAGVQTNRSRMRFISAGDAQKVIDACPDPEWRLIIALSRFGGLRIPSELAQLKWSDMDWNKGTMLVHSPKTEGHEGRAFRLVPLFPELRRHLLAAFERAEVGAEFVITGRRSSTNLRTQMHRIIRRAGLVPWPKPFQNLRSSRQTELAETYPIHVVCAWIGNTPAVAQAHYLQVTDAHLERAVGERPDVPAVDHGAEGAEQATQKAAHPTAKAAQNAAQQAAAFNRTESQTREKPPEKTSGLRPGAVQRIVPQPALMTPWGFEPQSSP